MKLTLTLSERWGAIITLALMKQGSLQDLQLIKKSLDTLRISETEKEEYGIVIQGQKISWKESMNNEKKEFTVDKGLTILLNTRLQNLSDLKLLSDEMISIAEKLGVK